jgi:hypothetical protein
LNFTRFIEWPRASFEDAGSPFAICVLGDDPFGAALDQLVEGEKVNGRKVVVRRMNHQPAAKACQVLYVSAFERDTAAVLEGLGPGVLTVGEGPEFRHAGGIIDFIVEGRHVRFDVNRGAASSAGLAISARLLAVARSVQ